MVDLKRLNKEIKWQTDRINQLEDELTYYRNRCKLLRKIVEKFKKGIKYLTN